MHHIIINLLWFWTLEVFKCKPLCQAKTKPICTISDILYIYIDMNFHFHTIIRIIHIYHHWTISPINRVPNLQPLFTSSSHQKGKTSSNIYSLLSVLLIFQFIYPTLGGPRTQGLIDKICRQVEDYGYCNKVYNQNIKTPETDIFRLAHITLEQGTNNATNIYLFARRLLGNTTDPALKGYLSGA